MYAMQYSIKLPSDYDMQIIHDRVANSGHLMDGFAGLGFKAFLVREKAHGAPVNEYAPFYVWNDVEGMRSFCWGERGYSAIVRDFGRHPIQDWTVADLVDGPAPLGQARSMTITTRPLPEGAAPAEVIGDLAGEFRAGAGPATVRRVTAVDVTSWSIVLAELSAASSADLGRPGAGQATYDVLHVSAGPQP